MPRKPKELPELTKECSKIITLFYNFIHDENQINEMRAWKGFQDFVKQIGHVSSNYAIENEYSVLKDTKKNIARLRTERNKHEKAGHYTEAAVTTNNLQSIYNDLIGLIEDIQQRIREVEQTSIFDKIKKRFFL